MHPSYASIAIIACIYGLITTGESTAAYPRQLKAAGRGIGNEMKILVDEIDRIGIFECT